MKTGPNIRKRTDGRFEARYEKGRDENGKIIYGYTYAKTFEEAKAKRDEALRGLNPTVNTVPRLMNLIILGAGGQSFVVKEVAESIGVFNKIAFLDDFLTEERVIGKCADSARFLNEYPIALPSVGNAELRLKWINMLISQGFILPTLISPMANVSPSAEIGYATFIEPQVTIGANAKIGNGCIICSGAVIGRNVTIPDITHIGCGVTVNNE